MIALRMNNPIINPKFLCREYLFQIIKTEIEPKRNITAHTNAIVEFAGVQPGRLRVLYHTLPVCAK